jgi:hypothetical protein
MVISLVPSSPVARLDFIACWIARSRVHDVIEPKSDDRATPQAWPATSGVQVIDGRVAGADPMPDQFSDCRIRRTSFFWCVAQIAASKMARGHSRKR